MNEYLELWHKYLDKIDELNDAERKQFCKFMDEASKPIITQGCTKSVFNKNKSNCKYVRYTTDGWYGSNDNKEWYKIVELDA